MSRDASPVHQPFKMPGWPVRIDGRPTRVTASPMMGEHTAPVLSEWLGLSGEAVAALEGRRRALIRAANQLPPSALRMSSPCDFHHWCSTVMSVPTEKCRTPMSRKYFA
jgi:hypothetical protein